jgi:hypothetical protein
MFLVFEDFSLVPRFLHDVQSLSSDKNLIINNYGLIQKKWHYDSQAGEYCNDFLYFSDSSFVVRIKLD